MNSGEYEKLIAPPLVRMKNIDVATTNSHSYLGECDADTEWTDNPNIAKSLFLHTKAYTEFVKPHSLILLGRTGTGKTSILRCMEEDVASGVFKDYKNVVSLNLDDIIKSITNFTDIDNSIQSKLNVNDSIEWIINVNIMTKLINDEFTVEDDLSVIKKYLLDIGLIDNTPIAKKAKQIVHSFVDFPGNIGKFASIADRTIAVINIIRSREYKEARAQLYQYTQHNKTLVLIDSLNEYDMRDNKTIIVTKSVINACFTFHTNKSLRGIFIKFALPSEIYTHLFQSLPGKQRGNTTVIQWNYGDLINFIAKRFYFYLHTSEHKMYFEFLKDYSLESLTNNPELANNLLFNILPESCPTSLNYSFDTLAYCIRHTLKKPRELMTIFNSFIDKIIVSGNPRIYFESPEMIKNIIHSTQEDMIGSALSMYASTYPKIGDACTIVLRHKNYIFEGKDIVPDIKDAASMTTAYGYGSSEIQQILLESGLIGVAGESTTINPNNKTLANEQEATAVFARFEYQVKGNLLFDKNEYYVIHPMCYEHFTCYLNPNVLVYVDKNSDHQDRIHTILRQDVL